MPNMIFMSGVKKTSRTSIPRQYQLIIMQPTCDTTFHRAIFNLIFREISSWIIFFQFEIMFSLLTRELGSMDVKFHLNLIFSLKSAGTTTTFPISSTTRLRRQPPCITTSSSPTRHLRRCTSSRPPKTSRSSTAQPTRQTTSRPHRILPSRRLVSLMAPCRPAHRLQETSVSNKGVDRCSCGSS